MMETGFSLNFVFDGLKPVLTKCQMVAMSICILSPVAFNSTVAIENKPVQIYRISKVAHKLTENEKVTFAKFSDDITSLVDTIHPFIDMIIPLAYHNGVGITDSQLLILEQRIVELRENTQKITQQMQQIHLDHHSFFNKLDEFIHKMVILCQVLKSAKYKLITDRVVSERLYKGTQSVGYTFNQTESFDEFKKAMMV